MGQGGRTSGRKGRHLSIGLTGLRMSFTPMAQPAQHARSQLLVFHVARCPMHLPCIAPCRSWRSALAWL